MPNPLNIICAWNRLPTENDYVGELIISGNSIDFLCRDRSHTLPAIYIGNDSAHSYAVVSQGLKYRPVTTNHSLAHASAYSVKYVLSSAGSISPDDINENSLTGISFTFPELPDWFVDKYAVKLCQTKDGRAAACEVDTPTLLLHEKAPVIELSFASETLCESISKDCRTEAAVKRWPRIFISYEHQTSIHSALNDVRALMQFWGLIIGHVSSVSSIEVSLSSGDYALYINDDLSYNDYEFRIPYATVTAYEADGLHILDMFSKWYSFFCDDKFTLIRELFFYINSHREYFAEDLFLSYARILESYHKSKPKGNDRAYLYDRLCALDNEYFNIITLNDSFAGNSIGPSKNASDQYIHKIVNTRNYYTHAAPLNNKETLNFQELAHTIKVLKALTIMIFFDIMGFDKSHQLKSICRYADLSIQVHPLIEEHAGKQ